MVFRSLFRRFLAFYSSNQLFQSRYDVRALKGRKSRRNSSNRRILLETLEDRFNPAPIGSLPILSNWAYQDQPKSIVFIDSNLTNTIPAAELVGSQVVTLNPNQDFFSQISNKLNGIHDLEVVRLITHGEAGAVLLGNQVIDDAALKSHSSLVQSWSKAMAPGADFLVYGCSVASTQAGTSLLKDLSRLTHTDVAGSTNITGAMGDTVLEFSTGKVTHSIISGKTGWVKNGVSLVSITSSNTTTIGAYGNGGGFLVTATGTAAANLTYSITGAPSGVSIDTKTGGISISPTTNAGTYGFGTITITVNDSGDSTTDTQDFKLIIPKAHLDIAAKDLTSTYGSTTFNGSTDYLTLGLVGLETIGSVTLTTNATKSTSGNYNYKATSWSLTPSAATGGTFNPANYDIFYHDGSLTVNQKSLTVSATGINKTYDATTNATVTLSDDRASGDVLTPTYSSATFTSPDAGNSISINVSGISISGTDSGNYTFNTTASTSAKISTAPLSVTAKDVTGTYGSVSLNGTTGFTSSGLQGGETIGSVTLSTNATKSSSTNYNYKGSAWTITPSAATGGTFNSANYTITYNDGQLTVNQKALTVSATGVNKTYDTNTTASVTLSDDRVGGDVLTPAYTTATFSSANAANSVSINVTGISISGADSGNYTFNTTASTSAKISPAPITVTAKNVTGTYGSVSLNGVTGFTSSGLLGGQTIGSVTLTTNATLSTSSNYNYNAAAWTITPSAATGGTFTASNYAISYNQGNLTVNKLGVAVSATPGGSKVYDGLTTIASGITLSAAGVVGIDVVSPITYIGLFNDKNVGVAKAVSISTIALTGTDAANYSWNTTTTTTATITAKALTVGGTTVPSTKVYDGTATSFIDTTSSVVNVGSGLVSGDIVLLDKSNAVGNYNNKNVGSGKPVTISGFTISGADATNYSFSQPSGGTADITKKALTVNGITASNKVYDSKTTATLNTSNPVYVGKVSGDALTFDYTAATGTFSDKNVGNGKTVTLAGIVSGGADIGNYTVTYTNPTANITPFGLTISGLSATNRVYDGTKNATITGSGTLVTPFASDTVSLTGSATGTFATKNVGNAIAVTVSGLSLTGGDKTNYSLTQPTLSANITKATLTVNNVTANNKVYDGTKTATLNVGTAALAGIFAPDVVTLDTSGAQGTFPAKTVGNSLTVTITGMTIGGADAGNYNLTQPSTTANITAKSVTVTGVTASDKVYDSTTTATINTGAASIFGKVAGDVANLAGSPSGVFASSDVAFSGPNVAAQNVNINGFTLTGADAGNYVIAAAPHQFVTTAKITPATLTVSFITAANKTYDGTTTASLNFSLATLNGVQGADALTLDSSLAVGNFANKNVGINKVVTITGLAVSGGKKANYTVANATTNANIGAKALTITGAVANNKVYDGTTAGTIDSTAAVLAGVVGFDQTFLDTNNAKGTFATKNVGTAISVAVSGYSLFGVDSANYTVTQPSGLTADITKLALTVNGVSANNKIYDGTKNVTSFNTLSATLGGVLSGETVNIDVSGIAGTYADKNVGTGKPITVTGITATGADAANYSVTQPSISGNITTRVLNFSNLGGTYTKVYDTTANAGITLSDDRVGGDALTTSFSKATFADKNVGVGKTITITGISVTGADAGNYTYSNPATITGNITARTLTVTATGVDREYDGTTNATVTLSDNRLLGDILTTKYTSATFASKAVNTTPPGTAISVTGISISGTDAGNYSLASTSASTNALITQKNLVVSGAKANDKVYDGKTAAVVDFSAAILNGVVGSEAVTLTPLTTAPTYSADFVNKNAGNNKVVTVSGLTLTGADAGNYTVSQPVLTASITPLGLTVSGITAADRQYDSTTKATLSLGGAGIATLIPADAGKVTLDTSKAVGNFSSPHVIGTQPVTITGLTLTGIESANYSIIAPVTTNAQITQKIIPAVDISKYSTTQVYGEPAELNPVTGSPYNQAGSVFYNTKVNIDNFTTSFQFQTKSITNSAADGITFVIQNQGKSALGANGEGLGYQGIGSSVAFKIDLVNNYGEGTNSTGLYTNGVNPSNPSVPSTSLSPYGLFFETNHIFQVDLSYNGTVLDATVSDLTARLVHKQSFNIDIPTTVGDTLTKQAYVGFTGSTGALASRQSILNWQYKNGVSTTIDYSTGFSPTTNLTFNGNALARGNPLNPSYPNTLNPFNPAVIANELVLTCPNKAFDYSTGINNETLPILLSSVGNSPGADVGSYAINGHYYDGTGLATDYDIQSFTGGNLTVGKKAITYNIQDQRQTYDTASILNNAINTDRSVNYLNTAGSVFYDTPVSINSDFKTTFTFQSNALTSVGADGIAFVLQDKGLGALGQSGEGLGYQGIQKSVAIKFDSFNNKGEGKGSTGIFFGGANPSTLNGSTDLTPQGFDFSGSDDFHVDITYTSATNTLQVDLNDIQTNAKASQTYNVNLSSKIFGNQAYIGFTGATGSQASQQSIKSWTFNGSKTFAYSDFSAPTPLVLNGSAAANFSSKTLVLTGNNPGKFIETGSNDEHLKLTLATSGLDVGTYPLTGVAADDDMQGSYSKSGAKNTAGNSGKLGNYNLTLNSGNVQINPADLVITAQKFSFMYGNLSSIPQGFAIFSGLKGTDSPGFVNYSTNSGVSTGGYLRASRLDSNNNPIPWEVIPTNATLAAGKLSNYNLRYVNGQITIYQSGLTIVPDFQVKTYGDTFAFNGTEFIASGLLPGDVIPYVQLDSVASKSTTDVGLYAINSSLARGDDATNYNIFYGANGFNVTPKAITVNIANKTQSVGSKAELNDIYPSNYSNQVGSFFTNSKVDVSTFSTSFKFKFSKVDSNVGEGFTFTIQGNSPNAVGGGFEGLGYKGIDHSLAVKFDLTDNEGEGTSSTGVYTNGAKPTNLGSDAVKKDNLGHGIDLQDMDDCQADINYDGSNIQLKITDLVTGEFFSKTYSGYDIPALCGNKMAYVGFTACTGTTVKQEIKSWTLTPASGPVVDYSLGFGNGANPAGLTINGDTVSNWSTGFITLTDQNYGQQILGANNETLYLFLTSTGNTASTPAGTYVLTYDGKIYSGTGKLSNYTITINNGSLIVS